VHIKRGRGLFKRGSPPEGGAPTGSRESPLEWVNLG
jgi:hypothetical protein